MLNDAQLREILLRSKTVAVYGMSRHYHKAAYQVPARLAEMGFEIFPVNPFASEIMERLCYPSLAAIPGRIDIVDVFRPSAEAYAVVEAALARHAARGDVRLIWLQSGIYDDAARKLAEDAGVACVQNRCMAVVVPLLLPGGVLKPDSRGESLD